MEPSGARAQRAKDVEDDDEQQKNRHLEEGALGKTLNRDPCRS